MTIAKWLKNVDPIGLTVKIYDGDEVVYAGSAFDIPYGFINATIGRRDGDDEEPIFFVDRFGCENSDDDAERAIAEKSGFVINIV